MIITCDIDGVLNDLTPKVIELYNAINCKHIQLTDITSYNFAECLPQEDANGICELFKKRELWDSLKPIPGSQSGLKKLINMNHKVYLATATHPENFSWKIEWLNTHFPFIFSDNVIRIMDKSLLKTDVLIDDSLDNLISNLCERICLDYPYNRSVTKDFTYDIYRAYRWDEIVEFVKTIERKDAVWLKQ